MSALASCKRRDRGLARLAPSRCCLLADTGGLVTGSEGHRTEGASAGEPRVEVLISVADGAFAEVTRSVQEAGGRVLEEMPELGTLSVSVSEASIVPLADIDGVEAIERPRTYQLPPPDSPVQ